MPSLAIIQASISPISVSMVHRTRYAIVTNRPHAIRRTNAADFGSFTRSKHHTRRYQARQFSTNEKVMKTVYFFSLFWSFWYPRSVSDTLEVTFFALKILKTHSNYSAYFLQQTQLRPQRSLHQTHRFRSCHRFEFHIHRHIGHTLFHLHWNYGTATVETSNRFVLYGQHNVHITVRQIYECEKAAEQPTAAVRIDRNSWAIFGSVFVGASFIFADQ